MNILTLNKTQASKLLKLCKEFFPEERDELVIMPTNSNDGHEDIHCLFGSDGLVIHWYQLCLTELPERILKRASVKFNEELCYDFYEGYSEDSLGIIRAMYRQEAHPVNFLWDFVQECKKNKYFIK